jgi:hypothetical protein
VRSDGLSKQDRDRARSGQPADRSPADLPDRLELPGQCQHLGLLGRRQIVVANEVPDARQACVHLPLLAGQDDAGRIENRL